MMSFTRQSRWVRPHRYPIKISPYDIGYFQALFRHGPLPSDLLHAFVRPQATPKKTTERLTELYSLPNAYIDRPPQQKYSYIANSRPLVHSVNEKSLAVLREHGIIVGHEAAWVKEGRHGAGKQYGHRLMVSVISALIELGLRNHPDVRFVSWKEILDRAPLPVGRARDPFQIPVKLSYRFNDGNGGTYLAHADTAISPDHLFGLQFKIDGRVVTRFFALEADRTVEFSRNDLHKPSHLKKFLAYLYIQEHQLYKKYWGISNLRVMTVTTSKARMERSKKTLADILKGRDTNIFLFKTMPDFATIEDRTPKATPSLINDGWERVGKDPLYINQP